MCNSKKGRKELSREIAKGIITYRKNLALATSDTQNPVITEEEINKAISAVEEKLYEGVTFKVQLAASSKKLETKPYNFKGLEDITRQKNGKIYRYFYGESSDLNEIEIKRDEAIQKGYSSAFIIAYKDGERIPLNKLKN